MQAWEIFLQMLATELGDKAIETWLRPLHVAHFDAGNLYLEADTPLQVEWFEEHIRPRAKKAFVNQNFRSIKIHLTCPSDISNQIEKHKKKSPSPIQSFILKQDPLLPEYTWDSFFPGREGIIIQELFQPLLTNSHLPFCPIVLYGPSSSGKTHLLQALTKILLDKKQKALYVRTETFTEHVISAIRSGQMREFRELYRTQDILLVDDIQYLAKKNATQEEFFHTFNALHSAGKQIILSMNKAPSFLEHIEPRLVSRFEWGLSLPLPKLCTEELLLLAKKRSQELNISLSSHSLEFLLEHFSSSPRSLLTSLEAIYLRTLHSKEASSLLSPTRLEILLTDLIDGAKKPTLSIERILHEVSSICEVSTQDILSKSQTQEHSHARQIAMFLCRELLNMPFAKIGSNFKRDHSTVMSGVKNIEGKIKNGDKNTKELYSKIQRKLEI